VLDMNAPERVRLRAALKRVERSGRPHG
jgi:hypothetical protein